MNKFTFNIPTKNNLLAFSAGVDSTTLFYLLVEKKIPFDIAIVDYGQRTQSKDEVIYATQLAHKYQKKCYISHYPKEFSFNEKEARDFRYQFFDSIMIEHHYETLFTAHQLNDKLEWFLMQLTKGAGLSELLGMQKVTSKPHYTIVRPLLDFTKEELKSYLLEKQLKFFEDESNFDQKYHRNYFRHNFSDELLSHFSKGILNSFHYLEKDYASLFETAKPKKIEKLSIYTYNGDSNIAIRIIDKELKTRGIIISKATRDEILEKKRDSYLPQNRCFTYGRKNFYCPV